MEFRILGALEVVERGQLLEIAGARRRAVLALLILRANEVVRTERLIDELWGDRPPANAAGALHNHVSRLRKVIGPDVLVRRERGYALRIAPEAIDAHVFERLVAEADPLPATERSERLAAALALWRGTALEDLAHEPALGHEIARLDAFRTTVLERRIEADLEAGKDVELIPELEALIAEQPLREHLRGHLILALYRAGRQAEALEVYRETRRVLAEELGLEPSPDLRELERAILRHDPDLGAAALPPAVSASASVRRPPFARRRGRTRTAAAIGVLIVIAVTAAAALVAARGHAHAHVATTPSFVALGNTTGPSGPARLYRISDQYAGTSIDDGVWYQMRDGADWALAERSGRLEFRFPPSTKPGGSFDDFGGHVGTLCKFPADFDARVDFALAGWPPGNGVTATLFSFLGPRSLFFQASRGGGPGGDTYSSYTGYWSNFSANDTSGSLRVARRNGIVTTYYRRNGRWQRMRSARERDWAVIAVGALGMTTVGFGGRPVVVDFTNFSVTGINPVCPPNAASPTG